MSETPDDVNEEVRKLREERDRLQAELAERGDGPTRPRWRTIATVLLIILALLSLSAAMPSAWVRRTFTSTDRYVNTVAPLASDPAVQEALARLITDAVFEALDVQNKIQTAITDRLPDATFISAPITQALRGFIEEQVLKLVQSDQFQALWTEANRVLHATAISALEGQTGTLTIENGAVTLNYLPLVNEALQRLGTVVSDLLGKPVAFPEITPDTLPEDAIPKIEAVTGVDLPDTFGYLVIYRSDEFAAAQQAYDTFNQAVYVVLFLLVVFTAAALWISPRRRRTLLQLMFGFAVVLVIERRLAIAGAASVVDMAKPENQSAVRAIADTLVGSLLRYTGWLLAAALTVAAVALVTGPYRWATAVRGGVVDLGRGLTGMASGVQEDGAVAWVADHRDAMMAVGAGVGVLVFLTADLSIGGLLVLGLLLGAYELLVWRSAEGRPTGESRTGEEP